jgi:hypothetical protein
MWCGSEDDGWWQGDLFLLPNEEGQMPTDFCGRDEKKGYQGSALCATAAIMMSVVVQATGGFQGLVGVVALRLMPD